jgi:hypothetical protein
MDSPKIISDYTSVRMQHWNWKPVASTTVIELRDVYHKVFIGT